MDLLAKLRIGMSRQEVVEALGPPDAVGGESRKYKTGCVYKYGDIELHFAPWKAGTLVMVYTEDENGDGRVLLQ
jgi:hypothetical protein